MFSSSVSFATVIDIFVTDHLVHLFYPNGIQEVAGSILDSGTIFR